MLPKEIDKTEVDDSKQTLIIVRTLNTLIDHLSQNEVKEEWPIYESEYYYIEADGEATKSKWANLEYENKIESFSGIYRTKEEAEAARDRIKELLKTI